MDSMSAATFGIALRMARRMAFTAASETPFSSNVLLAIVYNLIIVDYLMKNSLYTNVSIFLFSIFDTQSISLLE